MAINLDHFRNKLAGDAERLELNSQGTDLHRKGVSPGGKAVEWIREAAGLRTGENRQVMHAFVKALRDEYSPSVATAMEGRLGQLVGDGKPLSARVVRQVLTDADGLQAQRNAADNRKLADGFSHAGPQDRLSGYMASAVSVGTALGVDEDAIGLLFDAGNADVLALRQKIAQDILALGGKEPEAVSHGDARGVAEAAIRKFLIDAVNTRTIESVIGARDAGSPMQREIADLAGTIGVPAMAPLLADPDSEVYRTLATQAKYGLPDDRPATRAEVGSTLSLRAQRLMAGEVVKAGLGGSVTGLPDDPATAGMMGARMLDQARAEGSATQTTQLARMIQGEMGRLEQLGGAGRTAAADLQRSLLANYARIEDPTVKLAILQRERDSMLADARQTGDDGAYYMAAMFQNDIVALMLDDLGVEKTAQRAPALEALAASSPLLAKAMAELDGIEREYVASKGGDPDAAKLGWKDGRDQLARLREDARRIEGGSGSELQAFISARMRALTADMLAKAVAVLGPPPAPMAVVSLGSASRGEASPYSDVEFGILLDRPADQAMQDYTAKLSQLMRFQVGNLGENAGREAPAGFHWDTGGNTPLEDPVRFVGTADQLIARNLGENGNGGPTSMFGFTMFSNVELLYGPGGGDAEWTMVQDMQQKVDAHFRGPSTVDAGRSRGETLGRWAMGEGSSLARLRDAATADKVDVKALSRLPMLLAQGLALAGGVGVENGIAANSTLMRLAGLAEAGVISREDADTLTDALAKLGEIRIQAHLFHGEADDTVFLDAANANGGFVEPELRQVIQNLLPFVDRIEQYLADPRRPF